MFFPKLSPSQVASSVSYKKPWVILDFVSPSLTLLTTYNPVVNFTDLTFKICLRTNYISLSSLLPFVLHLFFITICSSLLPKLFYFIVTTASKQISFPLWFFCLTSLTWSKPTNGFQVTERTTYRLYCSLRSPPWLKLQIHLLFTLCNPQEGSREHGLLLHSPLAHFQRRLTLTQRRQTHHHRKPNKGINMSSLGPDRMEQFNPQLGKCHSSNCDQLNLEGSLNDFQGWFWATASWRAKTLLERVTFLGTSLVVWLRFQASTAGGHTFNPWPEN